MSGALPGAQGKTIADQNAIDETVAGGCSASIYTKQECKRQTAASASRRKELATNGG